MQLFAMMGGYQSPSPYDPLFSARDADGNFHSRLDVVGGLIDWWDVDTDRTAFDPGAGTVESAGSEDDIYQRLDEPYHARNAPFDSLQEMRLVRGVTDDFWATFVEPTPGDQESRIITIYGSGSVNPNEAPPEVLLARLCSFIEAQTLCVDAGEAAKFIQLMGVIRGFRVPFFTRSSDFLNFVEGRGGPRDLYPMLRAMLGEDSPLLFIPVSVPRAIRTEVDRSFVTSAKILTIQVTGIVGRSSTRIHTVTNFHERWSPPPPNAGGMPGLGVFHYYRID
jgi:general secretion pathway protein K